MAKSKKSTTAKNLGPAGGEKNVYLGKQREPEAARMTKSERIKNMKSADQVAIESAEAKVAAAEAELKAAKEAAKEAKADKAKSKSED